MATLKLNQPTALLYVPDARPHEVALARTTHLGIGAHHDDLEIMAVHGILECYRSEDKWFSGVTCTDGAGSPRVGAFADYTDAQMIEVRQREQNEAARIGQYGFMAQLAYPSATVKDTVNPQLVSDLQSLLSSSRPEIVYTHNPADKHPTHVSVFLAALAAIRHLPLHERPKRLLGSEVWRDLDWLDDNAKVVLDVSAHAGLADDLVNVFQSQIAGGKRYDLAAKGRRRAHATFLQSHDTDTRTEVCFAMDLTPLLTDDSLDVVAYIETHLDRFWDDVATRLRGV